MNRLTQLGQMNRLTLMAAYFTNILNGHAAEPRTRHPHTDEQHIHGMSREALIAAVLGQEARMTTERAA